MKILVTFLFSFFLFFTFSGTLHAQSQEELSHTNQEQVYKAKVTNVIEEGFNETNGIKNPYQLLELEILNGPQKGELVQINHGGIYTLREELKVEDGELVVVLQYLNANGVREYFITDKYRLNTIFFIIALFFAAVLLLNRLKGAGSILGLIVSLLVIVYFIVPQILKGHDPLLISIAGATAIMLVTIYLAHGVSKKTTIALLATVCSFILAGILSALFVAISKLSGLGSEEAYSLQYGLNQNLNFSGLFLGGILIGTLGVLDDVTTSLSASVYEIASVQKKVEFSKLFINAITIGREHISSLVNTLVLAYAGASLPVFLFIVINPSDAPLWSILNSQIIAEEIIRGIAGSFGIVLAVPITALLASAAFSQKK